MAWIGGLCKFFRARKLEYSVTESQETNSAQSSKVSTKNDLPFRFLDLPGEIRNQIYEIIFPTAQSPTLIEINPLGGIIFDYSVTSLAQGIYRSCKVIHHECPSLEHLLNTGAIVPVIKWEPLKKFGNQDRNENLIWLLRSATRLRFVCSGSQKKSSITASVNSWKYLEVFIYGRQGEWSFEISHDILDIIERRRACEITKNSVWVPLPVEKSVEFFCPYRLLKNRNVNTSDTYTCIWAVETLLLPPGPIDNLQAVKYRCLDKVEDPKVLKKLNREGARRLDEYKKQNRDRMKQLMAKEMLRVDQILEETRIVDQLLEEMLEGATIA